MKRPARQPDRRRVGSRKRREDAVRELFQADVVREAFQEWGRTGGKTRAKKLSAEERREIARKASLARWGRRKPVS
jgi:hypothetical protein